MRRGLLPLSLLGAIAVAGCGREAPRVDSASAIGADLRRAAQAGPGATAVDDAAAGGADSAWVITATGQPRRVPVTALPPDPDTPSGTSSVTSSVASSGTSSAPSPPVAAPAPGTLAPAPVGVTGNQSWCASPRAADQQRCLRVYLEAYDARLNGTYQALITALERQAGPVRRGREPEPVRRLRVAQRAWLDQRDAACRAQGRGAEGALWAPTRARCLGDAGLARANELAAELRAVDSTAGR